MFDALLADVSSARTPTAGVRACARLENAACAARLRHMADMLSAIFAQDGSAEREQWRFDNWSAVCAQIGAAQAVTSGVASGLLMDAVALAERLPAVAAVFAAGEISYRLVHRICLRTMMVTDPDALKAIDAEVAVMVVSSGALSMDAADKAIDGLVLAHDPYAVRRTEVAARGHRVTVRVDDASGTGYLEASMSVLDVEAVDRRADALARTVCDQDPRTLEARRSAALGAMGFGWDRLPCLCERADCDATSRPAAGGVVIHVIAREDTIAAGAADPDGPAPEPPPDVVPQPEPEPEPEPAPTGDLTAQRRALTTKPPLVLSKPWYRHTLSELMAACRADRGEFCPAAPGVILGGGVVPAPVLAQAALHARMEKLTHPGQAPPQPRYRPSKALADFVRCRDGTCRFPGCTRVAVDIDHTIPYPFGATAASNLVCLCREHHLCKTFWPGWDSHQFSDGTVLWTDPVGQRYTTYPGNRWLFAELCAPTAEVNVSGPEPTKDTAGLMMPKRATTRVQARRQRIEAERRQNAGWAERYLQDQIPPF